MKNNLHRALVTLLMTIMISVFTSAQVIYDSLLNPMPGNVGSVGFEATSADEFGDRIIFGAGGRKLVSVTQTMSSWGCENGGWNTNDCSTTPGSTFSHPITLNIYAAGAGNLPGALLGTVTQTFAIPYRPSADPVNCTGGRWFDGASCYNGFATNITFNASSLNLTLPNSVIYSVAYNTSHHGNNPVGEAACFTESGGCGYDSLNVGLEGVATVGANADPDDAWWDTTFAGFYCDGGLGGLDIFRRDAGTGCWTDFQPAVRVIASNVPANANQCKQGGWATRTRADGSAFKNQGDCIQYVNTGR